MHKSLFFFYIYLMYYRKKNGIYVRGNMYFTFFNKRVGSLYITSFVTYTHVNSDRKEPVFLVANHIACGNVTRVLEKVIDE